MPLTTYLLEWQKSKTLPRSSIGDDVEKQELLKLFIYLFIFKVYLFVFRQREKEGERMGEKHLICEKKTLLCCLSHASRPAIKPATQACTLMGIKLGTFCYPGRGSPR